MRKTRWVICSLCDGHGKVENDAFANGFTSSEWAELDLDERAAYLAGEYDVECEDCGGTGKAEVPNVRALTFTEKRHLVRDRREQRELVKAERELLAEMAAERACGA